MSKRVKQSVSRSDVFAVIAEMLEDAFGEDDDVWYSVDVKTEGIQIVRMNLKAMIDGKCAGVSLLFDPAEMAHVDCVRPSVKQAIRAVFKCKEDPSLIGE